VAACCKHGNEISGIMKEGGGDFLLSQPLLSSYLCIYYICDNTVSSSDNAASRSRQICE
jgi:hypothetical protein